MLDTFGKRMKRARWRRGWEQQELAHRAGLSAKYTGQIERDDVDPRASIVVRLAKALEVSTDTLLVKAPADWESGDA